MDRRLLGIIVIVLLLSSAGVFTLAMLKEEPEPLVMLQNDYPKTLVNIEREGKYYTFAHGFVARRDLAELEIRFSFLHYSPEPALLDREAEHGFANYADAGLVRSYLGADNFLVDEYEADVTGQQASRIRVFDISRSIIPFSDRESAGFSSAVYGQIMGDANVSFLRGVCDFFYDRSSNVEYIVIAHGTNETVYSSSTPSLRTIEQAPKGGVVVLRDIKKGDVVAVQFTVVPERERMPEPTWSKNYARTIYEVFRVYANGLLVLARANPIEVDLV